MSFYLMDFKEIILGLLLFNQELFQKIYKRQKIIVSIEFSTSKYDVKVSRL